MLHAMLEALGTRDAVQGGGDAGSGWRPRHRALASFLCGLSALPALSGQGQKAGHLGFLACSYTWVQPEALSWRRGRGLLSLLSAHPVADPASLGAERGQLPGAKPRRAEVTAGRWAGWLLGEGAASRGRGGQARTGIVTFSSCRLPGGPCESSLHGWPSELRPGLPLSLYSLSI